MKQLYVVCKNVPEPKPIDIDILNSSALLLRDTESMDSETFLHLFTFQVPFFIFTSIFYLYFYLQMVMDYNDLYVKHYLILFLLNVLIWFHHNYVVL